MFASFQRKMMEEGIFLYPYWGKPCHHGYSSVHTTDDINTILAKSEEVLRRIRQ
jgi:glutamate-1-semialdehyde aminotransferase